MGKRGPKPTSKAVLEARGSLRGKYDFSKYEGKTPPPTTDPPVFPQALDQYIPLVLAEYPLKEIIKELPEYDPFKDGKGYHFDEISAARFVAFSHHFCVFVQGDKSSQPFILSRHQIAVGANLFGWLDARGKRRYRECLYSVARGGGKTPFGALVALYMLLVLSQPGSEVYSCAGDFKQAARCMWFAKQMIRRSPQLNSLEAKPAQSVKIFEKAITLHDSQSYKVIASDGDLSEGQRVFCVIFDELHVQPTRVLFDSMKMGAAKDNDSLFLSISTVGHDLTSVMFETYDYACRVRDHKRTDHIHDPHFLPCIWQAEMGCKIDDPKQWKKAQPNLNVSIMEEDIARECKRALATPGYMNTFKTKCLNQWTEQASRWLSIEQWDRCKSTFEGDLTQIPCHIALDLSLVRDLTCVAAYFPSIHLSKVWSWHPEEPDMGMREKEDLDHAPYRRWADDGWLNLIAGKTIQKVVIQDAILDLCNTYKVEQVVLDEWQAQEIYETLKSYGYPTYGFHQDYKHYTAATLELERLMEEGIFNHLGNPVMKYCAQNVCLKIDKSATSESRRPIKGTNENLHIDAIAATCMAIGSTLMTPIQDTSSAWIVED